MPRGEDVDDRVPESHQGENNAGDIGKANVVSVRVDERVHAIDGRRDLDGKGQVSLEPF